MTGTTAKLDSKTEKLAEIATETAVETPAPASTTKPAQRGSCEGKRRKG